MTPPVKLSIGGKRVIVKAPSGSYAKKPKRSARSKPTRKEVKNMIKKAQAQVSEFKYAGYGPFNYDGTLANVPGSFYGDENGMIKLLNPIISQGTGHTNRIGDSVVVRRILLQYVLRWPKHSDTPLWNTVDDSSLVNRVSSDLRTDIPIKIHLVRFEYADGAMSTLDNYMDGFKRMYTLQELMSGGAKDLKKQEVRVLGTRNETLRRRLVQYSAAGVAQYHHQNVEGVINFEFKTPLKINYNPPGIGSQNTFLNYRFGVVLQFGHLADQFLLIDKKYNPVMQLKTNTWYTDA